MVCARGRSAEGLVFRIPFDGGIETEDGFLEVEEIGGGFGVEMDRLLC